VISLHAVRRSFAGGPTVGPIDLEFQAGRTTVLLGPSGSGKSTILRLCVALAIPDSGRVEFAGEELAGPNLRSIRHRIGLVTQEGGLFPHLTARGNAELSASDLGWSLERRRARTAELSGLVRLPAALLNRYPGELSGGERQRAAILRALYLAPDVLLLDEPLGALDPLVRAALQEDLREVFRSLSTTTILVTHDLAEAVFFADTIVLLRDGRVVQQGKLEDLTERPAEAFVGEFLSAQRSVNL
jgi:osmoprotectant transport system ATP-binding protein